MKLRLALSATLLLTLSAMRAEEKQGLVIPFKTVSVSSPVLQEVIDSVLVDEGAEVTEGQPIVQLRAEREALEVERTQKLIELGTFKSEGAQTLFKEKMGSKEKWLEEQAQLELSKILHKAANNMFKEKTVRAPLAGLVVKKYKEAGESVDRAEKLMDIVNIDQVYVQFYLDPALMEKTKEGQDVRVKIPVINNAEFTGKITFVDPRIDAGSGFFRVKVLLENKARTIKAGMRATADFGNVK
ncbi:MAG: efflux RND transporter periplasmic adaptor subunit [Chthoniobacteraceae bacterium]